MSKQKVIKVVIKRSKWLRGTGDGTLLNEDGERCCLGFLGKVCGYSDKDLKRKGTPMDLNTKTFKNGKWPKTILSPEYRYNTDLTEDLVSANDDTNVLGANKERRIKSLGKKGGIDFQFVD